MCLKLNVPKLQTRQQKTWSQTLEEAEKGYVWFDNVQAPQSFVLAKRFGLKQSDEVRMIDDCAIGGLNKAIGVVEKYKIHSVEEIAAFLSWTLNFMKQKGLLVGPLI